MRTIEDLVRTAQERLNQRDQRGRIGQASLLVRDPREDRLVLLYSTSSNLRKCQANANEVKDPGHYFDGDQRCYFYPLYDRLAEPRERNSQLARESRGLTGWVALTGHYLVVNGKYGKHGLVTLDEDRPETTSACQTYGHPIWGHHICETASDPTKPDRYIAVPVKSSADTSRTVGVLRYACPCTGRELSDADLFLLRDLSDLISASLGLDATFTRALRGSHITERQEHLRRTYNLGEFLEFLARSLRSNIASVYLDVGDIVGSGESMLRLLDAFGIGASVAHLRDEIQDYQPREGGFTRWLFDQPSKDPTVVPSVHVHKSWKGKNTLAFYGEQFRTLMEGRGATRGQPTEAAKRYEIKIMGIPLFSDGERVGVVKVELPNSFDDSKHYDKNDQAFLASQAVALGEVLGDFRSFLKCQWFVPHPNPHTVSNVARMAAELLRTRVVSPAEAKDLWSGLDAFINTNQEQIRDESADALGRLPPGQREVVQESHSWMRSFVRMSSLS